MSGEDRYEKKQRGTPAPKKHAAAKIAKRLYGLLDRRQKIGFLLIVVIMAVSAALAQMPPKAIGWLTDDLLAQQQMAFGPVLPFLGLILVVNVGNELIKILRRVMVEDTATRTEKKARGLVIRALLRAPLSYFKENMTGNIHGRLNRCLEGTVKLEKLFFMDFAPAIFNSVAAIIVIFTTLPVTLALPMLLVIPIGTAIVLRQIETQKGIRVELLDTKAAMDGAIVELLGGIEVIRVLDSVSQEGERFEKRSEFLRAKEMRHHLQMAKYDSLKFINEAVFTVLMIGISTYLAAKGQITVGSVLTAYLCFAQLLKLLEELHRILDELAECTVLAEDFFAMIDLPADFSYTALPAPEEQKTAKKGETAQEKDLLQLEGVSFEYRPGQEVLRGIDLAIKKGSFVGIAGPSGCGKSTLIKLLCRPEKGSGKILMDGRPLESMTRAELARRIALVPQSPFLIAGTVRENICYGLSRTPSQSEIEMAAKRAQLYDEIQRMPQGFDTLIAEGGGNLSGGQRQRVAIARIFLRAPQLLILDEATAALDNTCERSIQQEIERLKEEGVTVLSIAHRLTTLENCDEILVFDRGKICQTGSYRELIAEDGIFSDMYHGRLK